MNVLDEAAYLLGEQLRLQEGLRLRVGEVLQAIPANPNAMAGGRNWVVVPSSCLAGGEPWSAEYHVFSSQRDKLLQAWDKTGKIGTMEGFLRVLKDVVSEGVYKFGGDSHAWVFHPVVRNYLNKELFDGCMEMCVRGSHGGGRRVLVFDADGVGYREVRRCADTV